MQPTLRALLLAATATACITAVHAFDFEARGAITPYGFRADEILPADLDDDGDLDLVVRAHLSPTVQIFENTGGGRFERGVLWESSGDEVLLTMADFDADGLPDLLLTTTADTHPVRILYGSGLAGYGPREKALGSLPDVLLGTLVQDVDGSGKPDLIIADRTILDPSSSLPLNVVTTDNSDLVGHSADDLRWGDWNGDGRVDVLQRHFSQLYYWLNAGDGTFSSLQIRDLPASLGESPWIEDLRMIVDSHLPGGRALVAVVTDLEDEDNSQKLCLLSPQGASSLVAWSTIPFTDGNEWCEFLAQEPGKPLLASVYEWQLLPDSTIGKNHGHVTEIGLVFKGGLNPRLTTKTRVKFGGLANVIRQADVDGDGDDDLLASCSRNGDTPGGELRYHRSNGKGAFAAKPNEITPPATDDTATHLTDFDGDGDLDIIVHGHSPVDNEEEIALLVNDGDANFRRRVIMGGLHHAEVVSIADRNGDARPDLVVSSYGWRKKGNGERSVLLSLSGKGKARKTLTLYREAADSPLDQVKMGDWDEDDVDDLLLWETKLENQTHPVRWLKGAASNKFGAPQSLGDGFYEALQDMNGDGDLDLVPSRRSLNRGEPASTLWRENIGTQLPPASHTFPALAGVPETGYAMVAAEADLGGDFRKDLLTFFTSGDTDVSRPVLVATPTTLNPLAAFPPGEPWFQDVDGDGDTDVLLVTEPNRYLGRRGLALLENSGGGSFAEAVEIAEPSYAAWGPVLAGDLDGDGKQDIVTSDIQRRPRIEWFKGK